MTEMTPLDRAHAEMTAAQDDPSARLDFYGKLAASELFMMLSTEPGSGSETVSPEVFDVEGASYVLVFDREARLSDFAGSVAPYVALSGRAISGMLAERGLGMGVNLGCPASIMLPPEAVVWLHETLANAPDEVESGIAEVDAPAGLPERLISALDARLAAAAGLAHSAYLVSVTYDSGARGHMLGIVDAFPEAQRALAQSVADALSFSGLDTGVIDVAFPKSGDPITARLARAGLRFDLPRMQQTVTQAPSAPGTDPENPPKLK